MTDEMDVHERAELEAKWRTEERKERFKRRGGLALFWVAVAALVIVIFVFA